MSAHEVLLASLLLGAAGLLRPRSRRATAISSAPLNWSGAGLNGGPRQGRAARIDTVEGARASLVAIWHEDPVELLRRWRLRRRPGRLVDSVLDLLDGIRPALEAGLSPARAVEIAAASSMGPDILRRLTPASTRAAKVHHREIERLVLALLEAAQIGDELSSVWAAAADRGNSSDLAFVASAWRLSESTGAPLASAVGKAADGLRDARARRGRVGAAVAGPKATVTVLTALPVTGPLFGMACGVDPMSMYFGSGLTIASLVVGLFLIVLGRAWCLRIVRKAVAA